MGKLPAHGRYEHSSIFSRPAYDWPGGKKLAVYFALGIEHYAFNEGLVENLVPGIPAPDVLNTSWREYGNRVGAWRVLNAFTGYKLPLSILLNTAVYEEAPDLMAACSKAGCEMIAHGYSNSETLADRGEAPDVAERHGKYFGRLLRAAFGKHLGPVNARAALAWCDAAATVSA